MRKSASWRREIQACLRSPGIIGTLDDECIEFKMINHFVEKLLNGYRKQN